MAYISKDNNNKLIAAFKVGQNAITLAAQWYRFDSGTRSIINLDLWVPKLNTLNNFKMDGLLGSPDNNPANEFKTRNGDIHDGSNANDFATCKF